MEKNLLLLIAFCFALINNNVYAQAGSLDTSFNGTGKVISKLPGKPGATIYSGYANAIALQADDKIVIGGTAGNRFLSGRYTTNGKVDTSYNHIGFRYDQISDKEIATPKGRGIAIQNDGKIVLVGSTAGSNYPDFWLLRFFPDGSADFTQRYTDFLDGISSYGTAVALLSDQSIIEVGYGYGFLIAKFKTNGYLDSSFGTNGKVSTLPELGLEARSVAIEPNDQIIAAGAGADSINSGVAIVKYKLNGTTDSSFGINGVVITDLHGNEAANAVKILPDGKILAAGTTNTLGTDDFFIIRYNPNGTIDSSFGTNGVVITAFDSGASECSSMGIYNNKIVLGGSTNVNGTEDFAVAQYIMNGSLDSSFGTNGKTITDFGKNESAAALVIQNDGKIVLAGGSDFYSTGTGVAVARYNGSINNVVDTTTYSVSVCSTNLPYNYKGNNYDSSGNYYIHFTGTSGSDSVVELVLNVLSPGFIAKLQTNRVSICKGEYATLTANTTKGEFLFLHSIDNGATYQSSKQFKEHIGTYKVLVKDSNDCIATTNTITITRSNSCLASAAIADLAQIPGADKIITINAFPNPSVNDFVLAVKGGNANPVIQLKVTDMSGKIVYQSKGFSNSNYKFGKNFASGVYAIQVFNGKNVQTIKVVKN